MPAAPKSCTTARRARADRNRSTWRASSESQTAALPPNAIGTAGCERCEPVAERAHDAFDAIEGAVADERETGIHHVLRRRTAVQMPTRGRGSTHNLVEERQDRIAHDERLLAQVGEVDVLEHRCGRDLLRGLGRDHAELGLRPGERALDLEPRCDERLLGEEPDHLLIAEDVDQRREHRPTILGLKGH